MANTYTERWTEVNNVADILWPANRAAGVYDTDWLWMGEYHRAVAVLKVGGMALGSTLDLVLQEAQDAAGTGAQNIAGKFITQLTDAGGDAKSIVMIELRTEEMTPGYDFIRVLLTVGVAASFTDLTVIRHVPRYPPVPVTAYDEVVD